MKMLRTITLIVVSLTTGLLWRAELEIRWGWASLDWIGQFHWSFPIAAGIYLFWMNQELDWLAERKKRLVLGTALVLGVMAYFVGGTAMSWTYNRWIGLFPRLQCISYMLSPVVVYAVLGTAYFIAVAKLASPSVVGTIVGGVCYVLAFPVALLLLWVTDHRGGPDPIHAIKSGFVFPIIAFALGSPITMTKRAANQGLVGADRKLVAPHRWQIRQ